MESQTLFKREGTADSIFMRNIVKYKSFRLPDLVGESLVLESDSNAARVGDREGG